MTKKFYSIIIISLLTTILVRIILGIVCLFTSNQTLIKLYNFCDWLYPILTTIVLFLIIFKFKIIKND